MRHALLVIAVVMTCKMQLEWTTSINSYTPGTVWHACADRLVITHGKVAVKTIGDGIFKAGFDSH